MTKNEFALEAVLKALVVTNENEWRRWVLIEGFKVGFTVEELADILFS